MTEKNPQTTPNTSCSHKADISVSNTCTCGCTTCRKPRYWLWVLGFAIFYVATAMPVGLLLYAAKNEMGWNMFRVGGFHRYVACLQDATKTHW